MQEALDLALARLWEEGCPLADPTCRAHMISIGVRRWRSFERRNRRKHPALDDRIGLLGPPTTFTTQVPKMRLKEMTRLIPGKWIACELVSSVKGRIEGYESVQDRQRREHLGI